jgi:dolichol-phosphate mannosyltransferase
VRDRSEAPAAGGLEPPAAATASAPPLAPAARLRAGVRKPQNWLQLAKFCAVGGSGYAVNLAVFAFAVEVGDLHHLVAATLAFLVAVTNNFWWNRHWTFGARAGHAGFQAARFLVVSVVAFVFAATVLELLVTSADMAEIPAQAISIVVATPLSFLGNKMWSFGSGDWRA